ncbi:exodeoxyribonuclease III [Zopfia rhizophila CBS 207.26]|uniref:Exodeoxyribonuclease III n=1 Tax=Zopfia rhizophila CBS 207.26 TaxID=1314779 RepID=A0A6A6E8F6_9PEZI|nr:exodeoxyribonuclease III [Zopfia rhizophila CBS 207.26]
MDRNISPPPFKRRKTAQMSSSSAATQPIPVLSPPDDPKTIRIFSWNINGITPFLQKPITNFFQQSDPSKIVIPPASLRGFLQRHHWPHVFFLQEVKIASSDAKTQDAVRIAVNIPLPSENLLEERQGPKYDVHFTLPRDHYNARGFRGNGKVYGVCSIIRSDFAASHVSKVRTVDWDQEGRVSVTEISSPIKLALFNIYAVNGTENPYRDPETGVVVGTRHDRKLAFHKLLMEECLRMEREGQRVFLAGDFNVAPDARDGFPKLRTFPQQHALNRADFNKKFFAKTVEDGEGMEGVDIWREMHGDERKYSYFPRSREWGSSCDRVDYVIAGKTVWDAGLVKACGILDSEGERGPSDHVPIWVELVNEKMEVVC